MQLAQVQQQNYGTAALSISDALRVEAIECCELLQPYGKTLRDAAKFYAVHLKAVTGSRKVSEVVVDLLAARAADGMSLRYLGDLRVRLGRFVDSFGEEMIAGVSAFQIDEWLRGLRVGAVTRNTFRRRLYPGGERIGRQAGEVPERQSCCVRSNQTRCRCSYPSGKRD